MAAFTAVGFVDPFDLLCSLKGRLGGFQGTGLRVLHLRAPRKSEPEEYLDTRELARWSEARAILDRIALAAKQRTGANVDFGRIFLEMLDAGTGTRPRRDLSPGAQRYARLICGLRCNPGAILWCPPEQHVLSAGEVVMTASALYHGAINMGEFSRINMVIDVASIPNQPQNRETEEPANLLPI